MKKIYYVLFSFVYFIFLNNCASNVILVYNTDIQQEKQFIEETGGFSLIIPSSWQIINNPPPGFKYKAIRGIEDNNTLIIAFTIDYNYDIPLNLMIDFLIHEWNTLYMNDFQLIYRSDFSTNNNIVGEKLITSTIIHGERYLNVVYFFPGDAKSIGASCTMQLESKNIFIEYIDKIMKTFKWI